MKKYDKDLQALRTTMKLNFCKHLQFIKKQGMDIVCPQLGVCGCDNMQSFQYASHMHFLFVHLSPGLCYRGVLDGAQEIVTPKKETL